jgi:hypothetical protein
MAKANSLDSVNITITDIYEKCYHVIPNWPCCRLSSDTLFDCTSKSLSFDSLGGRRWIVRPGGQSCFIVNSSRSYIILWKLLGGSGNPTNPEAGCFRIKGTTWNVIKCTCSRKQDLPGRPGPPIAPLVFPLSRSSNLLSEVLFGTRLSLLFLVSLCLSPEVSSQNIRHRREPYLSYYCFLPTLCRLLHGRDHGRRFFFLFI